MADRLPIKIELPEHFLDEEKREGYLVSSKMKKVWAVELDMLIELDRICKKHGLRYYADSGTLLGAVRHHGFIPWDDDIDIVMFRDDYKELCKIAPEEFTHPYFFQTLYNEDDLFRTHAQIRNSMTTGFLPWEESKKYNRGLFLDIFPLDILPDNKAAYKIHIWKIKQLWKAVLCADPNHRHLSIQGHTLSILMKVIYHYSDYKEVFRKYESLCSKYNKTSNKTISYVAFSQGKEKNRFRREWWDQSITLPFEFVSVPAPAGFDGRLRQEYGEYMEIRHVPSFHGDTVLDPEIPYTEYSKKATGDE